MKKIIIDGTSVKKKSVLRKELKALFKSEDWEGTKLDEFVDRISGFSQVPYFKSADESPTQFMLIIKNSDELFEKSPSTFKWLMRNIMQVNRTFKEKLDVDEGLITMKLL